MFGDPDLAGIDRGRDFSDRRITADYLVDAIRDAISRGDLADGAVLNQADLAEHFGVSRVPVREAMRQLQAEGLVESRAHRVAVVRGLDLAHLIEVYTLRSVIEGWLIEQAVTKVDAETLKHAVELNDEMETQVDHEAWLKLNSQFHRLLYEASGATLSLEFLDQLRLRSERYARMWSRGTGIHRPTETCREHAEILALVAAGDAAGARAAVERHVRHTRDRVVEVGRARSLAVKDTE